jgi:lysophospholipase L1-like esterase
MSNKFNNLLVFGDSMSDNGLENGHGFNRYSNGKVWPEYLAAALGAENLDVQAYGGAMSGNGNYNPPAHDWSGLLWQVENYTPGPGMNETLVAVQIGFNDLHDPSTGVSPRQVVDNLKSALEILTGKGAVDFLVWDIHTAPIPPGYLDEKYELYSYYQDKLEAALQRFAEFNRLLAPALREFAKNHDGVDLCFFEAARHIAAIAGRFAETKSPWPGAGYYAEKDKWFWYDHWHFTTDVHRYLSEAIHQMPADPG